MKIHLSNPHQLMSTTSMYLQLNVNTISGIFDSVESWFFGLLISLLIHEHIESVHIHREREKMMLSLNIDREEKLSFHWLNIHDKINAIVKETLFGNRKIKLLHNLQRFISFRLRINYRTFAIEAFRSWIDPYDNYFPQKDINCYIEWPENKLSLILTFVIFGLE